MAAEAVVSFVVGKLGDLLVEEAILLGGVSDEIEGLKSELELMQCFLKDADNKQKKSEIIRKWVAQIRDVSYSAEDVIDTFISEIARSAGLFKRLSTGQSKTHHKVGEEIRRIRVKLNDISRMRQTYGISDINEATSANQDLHDHRRYLAERIKEPEVVGFEKDRETLKEQLINGDSRRAVISIVGMGGSGKTTLAKKIYHDVKKDFDCCAFIYLSQQYEVKDILIRIIKCVMNVVSPEEMEKANEQDLGKKLSNYLTGKKYLVVIDDIWTMKAWDAFNDVLPDGVNKSRVMLTTRKREVALHADNHLHEIRLLDDRDSWELFLKKVFPQGSPCPLGLEEMGRKIVTKCGGLPLPIVVLGALLSRRDKTLSAWSRVLASVTRHLDEGSDKCMEILALSYHDLPYYLKPCFLYLGLFPEDFEIKSRRLIRLWIAEGFIRQRGNEILEDVAEDYLEELIRRSILQVASYKCNGSVRTCRIHDLLRDLSISEAKQSNFFEINIRDVDTTAGSALTRKCRRLALYSDIGESGKTLSALRSVLCFYDGGLDLLKLFNKSGKLLRVFDQRNRGMDLSKKMGEFVHLRYLRLCVNEGKFNKTVPPSYIANLHNLQTLELDIVDGVLPNAIWDLEQLRHLQTEWCEIEGQPRPNKLRNLQTLHLQAGSWIEKGLDKLTNLRKLGMYGDIGSYSNSLPQAIENLSSLRSFHIGANGSVLPFMSFACHPHLYKMSLVGPVDKLPDWPQSLMKVVLHASRLQSEHLKKLGTLPHLRFLTLGGDWCFGCDEWICSSPEFPELEGLDVRGDYLKKFIITEGAMPCLRWYQISKSQGRVASVLLAEGGGVAAQEGLYGRNLLDNIEEGVAASEGLYGRNFFG